MQLTTPLLETLAQDLAENIHALDQRVKQVSIMIKKKSPPIPNFNGTVSVGFKKVF
jgi:dihydroneopterin aldolase